MNRSPLREVVMLGGLALQSEDCAIRAAVHHRGERGGLSRIEDERHHQFIIWRAVLPIWHADLEKHGRTDLTLDCENGRNHFELKNWTGSTGERQLPMIQSDIYKLQAWERKFIIITSINPAGSTDGNIKFLLSRVVGLEDAGREEFRFLSENNKGEPIEFWVAGWPVAVLARPSVAVPSDGH